MPGAPKISVQAVSALGVLVLSQGGIAGTPAADAPPPAPAAHEPGLFPRLLPQVFDDQDGQIDLSKILDHPMGFFPLVLPITEPAVGAGAAFLPIFIDLPEEKGRRPNIWAAGAMATTNGSKGLFGGYSGYFDNDNWHVLGGAFDMSVNLDFYGLGNRTSGLSDAMRYNLDARGGIIGADRKVGNTPWRIGLRTIYAEITPSLDRSEDRETIIGDRFVDRFGPFDFSYTVSSLQASFTYDTRDNIFTPTQGLYSELDVTANLSALGGSTDYQLLGWTGMWFRPLMGDRLIFGLRGEVEQSFGDTPFYVCPSVALRGVPVQKYQGEGAGFTEAELRWQFLPRWSVLGFAGAGVTWPGDALFQDVRTVTSGGVGFRYLIARRHGLHAGVDLAYSDEETSVYIQFGSAWFRP